MKTVSRITKQADWMVKKENFGLPGWLQCVSFVMWKETTQPSDVWWEISSAHKLYIVMTYLIMTIIPTVVLTLLVIVVSRKILNCNSAGGYWKRNWSQSWVVSPYGVWYYTAMFSTKHHPFVTSCHFTGSLLLYRHQLNAGDNEVKKRTFNRSSTMPRDNVQDILSTHRHTQPPTHTFSS